MKENIHRIREKLCSIMRTMIKNPKIYVPASLDWQPLKEGSVPAMVIIMNNTIYRLIGLPATYVYDLSMNMEDNTVQLCLQEHCYYT